MITSAGHSPAEQGQFEDVSSTFMTWLRGLAGNGVRISEKIRLADLRSAGAGRGVGEFFILFFIFSAFILFFFHFFPFLRLDSTWANICFDDVVTGLALIAPFYPSLFAPAPFSICN